eukprot:4950316-Amphidinium_carterae.1
MAVKIASSHGEVELAKKELRGATLATSSRATVVSRLNLWRLIANQAGVRAFPLEASPVTTVAAVLKKAGYRSASQVLAAAVKFHKREFGLIPVQLEESIKDARRALLRDLGPPSRAQEVKLELWNVLALRVSEGAVKLSRGKGEPAEGPFLWGFGSSWLLRVGELLALKLHSSSVRIEGSLAVIVIRKSKTDQGATGIVRKQSCRCDRKGLPSCPFCSMVYLIKAAEVATGCTQADAEALHTVHTPLVSAFGGWKMSVTRAGMDSAVTSDLDCLAVIEGIKRGEGKVTSHFMRRSGAKELTRQGVPLHRVQWLGRWSSAAVLAYVEEVEMDGPFVEEKGKTDGPLTCTGIALAPALSIEEIKEQVLDAVRGFLTTSAQELVELKDLVAKELTKLVGKAEHLETELADLARW